MSEDDLTLISKSALIFIGLFLIFFGIILAFLSLTPFTDIKSGGLIIIGPIPFFFYSEESPLLIFTITFVIILILTFFTLYALRRRANLQ
ncbi:MAG: DUF131 domain-containing protein [Aigarchaeota archaeon]|nr:DUF131 domain-containing protein [Aigarchaeota archaeon]MCX8193397.1 DUF131 domain-containing protein [Nitrososphaeria archaeon]MDW7985927.1 DUF131 domain-containing protein [Nitrososphaerota archaeon]